MSKTRRPSLALFNLVGKVGQIYEPAVLPTDIKRGKPGTCFDTCALNCSKLLPKYQYIEGVVTAPDSGEWTVHAWLSDGHYAFDPTWQCINNTTNREEPLPALYIGIPMDFLQVYKFMKETKYQGVLPNHWRARDIFDTIILGAGVYKAEQRRKTLGI